MKYLKYIRTVIPLILITVFLSGCYTQFSNVSLDREGSSSMNSDMLISSKKSGDYYYWSGQETGYVQASDQVVIEKPHLYQDSYYDIELLEKEATLVADNINYKDPQTAEWYAENDMDPVWIQAKQSSELADAISNTDPDGAQNDEMMAFREKAEDHVYTTADFGWDQSAYDSYWGTRFGFWSKYSYNSAQRWYAVTGNLNRFQDAPAYFVGSRGPSFLSPFARFGTATIGGEAWAYQNFGFFTSPFGSQRDCGGSNLFGLATQLNGGALVGNNFNCLPFGIYSLMAYGGPDLAAYFQAYAPLYGFVGPPVTEYNIRRKFGYSQDEIIISSRTRNPGNRLTSTSGSGLYRSDGGSLVVRNNTLRTQSSRGSLNRAGMNRNRSTASTRSSISRSSRTSSSSGSGISRNTGSGSSGSSGVSRSRGGDSGSSGSRGSSGSSSNGKRGGGGK